MIYNAHYYIEKNEALKKQGESYDVKRDMYYRALVGEDGKGSKLDLIYAVSKYGTDSFRNRIYGDLIFMSVLVLIALGLTFGLVRFPRLADIYFDQKRGIVYTWRFGKILKSQESAK